MEADEADLEVLRTLSCAMQDAVRDRVIAVRDRSTANELAEVAGVTAADTQYRIDAVAEQAVLEWLEAHWPARWPVELVMEGLADDAPPCVFPRGQSVETCAWKCIVDPIDGTRSLMVDKRSAWVLSGIAPHRGAGNRLGDIVVAAMTELPVRKQRLSDQLSAVRGQGRAGVRAQRVDVDRGTREPVEFAPSGAPDLRHGFASLARFFPAGKVLLAQVEERLLELLGDGEDAAGTPLVFDDQYISSGGQLFELLAGRDRMLADLRPLAIAKLGVAGAPACHPYDLAALLIAQESGCIVRAPDGGPVDAPLDTTTPVAWVGFANEGLAARVQPLLERAIAELLAPAR